MNESPPPDDQAPPAPAWKRYPHVIPGTDERWFTFPAAEGDADWGATTWFIEGRLRGRESGREFAVMAIFALNRITAPFGRILPAGFHVFSLFDLDNGGTPVPFGYALDLVGRDQHGRAMAARLDVETGKPPAPVGGDRLRGVKTCCAQLETFSYFQTGLALRGRLRWGDFEEEVDGDVGWIDRQFAHEHFGAYTDLRNSRHRHEWRVMHLDNGWDLSAWQQFDAQRGDRLIPFSGVTAQGPAGEVRATTDFRIERLSFVRDPGAIRAMVPLARGPAWLTDRFHLSVRDWELSVTAEPLVPTPAHGMPIEYWNGPVRLVGTMAGRPVSGVGFHERSKLWHTPHDLVFVLRETLDHLPTNGPSGDEARRIADRVWNCDVLLARGDRAGTRRLLVEQVVPRMSLLAPPGREAAQNVLDDLLSILG